MSFLCRIFPDRKLTALRIARELASTDLQRAILSSDTQRINAAREAMQAATHAQLAHELAGQVEMGNG